MMPWLAWSPAISASTFREMRTSSSRYAGGGSITMTNRIYRVEPQDGTVLGWLQNPVLLAAVDPGSRPCSSTSRN